MGNSTTPTTDAEEQGGAEVPKRRATAESMATRQREISVSEFFTKNRHLLGFDNPAKALLTTVKEAVDNSLDACEEAGILPAILVEIREVVSASDAAKNARKTQGAKEGQGADEAGEGGAKGASDRSPPGGASRFRVIIEDNGPGIVKPQIPKIFAKLLYGSKFHRLKQSRGQQGIGISAAGLYGQLTTGKPMVITSKTGKGRPAFKIHLRIDTKRNQPDVVSEETVEWAGEHGTRVEIELVAAYRGGRTGVAEYLEQTVVANPHMALTFITPKGERSEFPRVTNDLPREAQEIKPHPRGVELGMLHTMLADSPDKSVKQVLVDDFSRISPAVAQEICQRAKVNPKTPADRVLGDDLERLHHALGEVKVMAPPATAVVPIGEELLIEGLKRRFPRADFYVSTTRPPSVYRGNPFVVEAGLAYGGELPLDELAEIMRFANRVPLQYQPKACAISEAVYQTNWRGYELTQSKGSLPQAPLAIAVHLASVWVPFTSEAKEAVAHYDDLMREMKLAIQECGRKLGAHLRARAHLDRELRRRSLFERYIPEVAGAISSILGMAKDAVEKPFYATLPTFVRGLEKDDDGSPPPPPEGGTPAPAAAAPAKPSPKGPGAAKSPPKTPAAAKSPPKVPDAVTSSAKAPALAKPPPKAPAAARPSPKGLGATKTPPKAPAAARPSPKAPPLVKAPVPKTPAKKEPTAPPRPPARTPKKPGDRQMTLVE
ncbi:MAG TPA: DNA topoisomerase VI subunit B [Polyangiaceae bacterium]|nr:DNA topoisomerase VI subunit B [Polyangiaceae bacterium]